MLTAVWVAAVLVLSPGLASPVPFEHGEHPTGEAAGTPIAAMSDTELQWVSDYLAALLREDPWQENESPLLYVEPMGSPGPAPDEDDDNNSNKTIEKRSRYYRRYPWKRVSRNRNSYDPDLYMCNPSRDDVIQLLVGLHRAREGDTGRTINFCNRKRPASAVFTNIRFIGRK